MDTIFLFLRDQLNAHLRLRFGSNNGDLAGFPSAGSGGGVTFDDGKITLVLVKIEEEKMMLPPNRYQKTGANGGSIQVKPELRLNLYFMLAAQFLTYQEALRQLTAAIRFFQSHPLFERQSHPNLPEEVERLFLEFASFTFAEQNELWSSLKAALLPCAYYKASLLLIEAEKPALRGDVEETIVNYPRA